MSGIFLRWGIPALVTVVGGTSLAISMTSENMASDLTGRTAASLTNEQFAWASVGFDGRDAMLSGTATDQQMIDDALMRVASVHGVRSVASNIVLAELVSPFPFTATVRDGAVTLSGGVPDETAHAAIALEAAASTDNLRLMSGAPDRRAWQAAVDYGLAHIAQFDEGEIGLSDLDLTISGRAKSPAAFDALAMLEKSGAPAGVKLAYVEVVPALASPFEWQATYDGKAVSVSGFTPSDEFVEHLRLADLSGIPLSTSLVLASGAPDSFEANADLLLHNLVQLEQGTAKISGDTLSLTGAPPDATTAAAVQLAMTQAGANASLEPPRVADYEFKATVSEQKITLDGVVPDAATKTRLEGMPNVDAAGLELARGAPERFDSAVEFGLGILAHLSEGSFTIRDTQLTIAGRASTVADFTAVETTLSLGAPQGLLLAKSDVKPPLATPFVWSAEKSGDGKVTIAGFVPSQRVRDALQAAVPALGKDSSTLADGNPADFETLAPKALAVLALLDTGKIAYDGSVWSLTGKVDALEKATAADVAFTAAGLRTAGWAYDVELPAPPALPLIDPYVWRAQKAANGAVTFGGFAPSEEFRQSAAALAGAKLTDNSNLGAGEPEGFADGALAGLGALLKLDDGALNFDGTTWTLSGRTADMASRGAIETGLAAATDTSTWQVAIQALNTAPVIADYTWMASKTIDGSVALSGYVPTEELKSFAAVRAGSVARDSTEIASGEPPHFATDVLSALEALSHLNAGTAKFESGKWSVAGTPRTAADATAARAAIATANEAGAGWVVSLDEPVTATLPETPAPAVEPEPAPPVDTATTTEPAATPEPAVAATPEPVVRNYVFEAAKPLGSPLVLTGKVPAETTKTYLSFVGGEAQTDALSVGTGLPGNFIATASAGVRILTSLASGEFGLDGDQWVLSGKAETDAELQAALAAVAEVPDSASWQTDIVLLPPNDLCRQKVASFASRNAILFQSGSAKITEDSDPALNELAGYLNACPDAEIDIEGHTDSDGDETLNLTLSVSRAEAVVDALIARGVTYNRLYAVGYGESLPIADNGTAAGKKANRRIAFTILDEHQ